MTDWVYNILNSDQGSGLFLVAALLLGILATFTSACNYAMIGSVAGFSAGDSMVQKKNSPVRYALAFFAGCTLTLTVLGGIVGYAGSSVVEAVGGYWKIIAALVFIIFGLLSFGFIPIRLPEFKLGKNSNGAASGFILGVLTGGLSMSCSACCNPVLPIVIGAAFVKASILWGLLILFAFSVGYSFPFAIAIAGIRFGAGKLADRAKSVGKYVMYFAGVIMIAAGFYLIYTF